MTQSELLHMAGAVDDRTINIILGVSIIIVVYGHGSTALVIFSLLLLSGTDKEHR